jgi:hypothetical protein
MQQIIEMQAEMKANAKANQEYLLGEMKADRKADREVLNEMREEIKSTHAEMRFTVCAIQFELKETIQHKMKAVIQPVRSELDEMTACNEATD